MVLGFAECVFIFLSVPMLLFVMEDVGVVAKSKS